MAHKARRRPSWKKPRSKYFRRSKWQRRYEILMKRMAKEIADEIDWEIMADLMVQYGWTKLKFNPLRGVEEAYDIHEWINTHAIGKVQSRGNVWLFEKEKDAVMFSLRWS